MIDRRSRYFMTSDDPSSGIPETEGESLPGPTTRITEEHLFRIARDAHLRSLVYEQIRDYCHQCRNKLNSLKLSIYLAVKQSSSPAAEAWALIDRAYQELESRVEQVQFLCRPIGLSRVTIGLDLLIDDRRETWTRRMTDGGAILELVPPEDRVVASFDVDVLGRALDGLVAWRAADRSASRSARLRWWVQGDQMHLCWEEAGGFPRPADDLAPTESPAWALPLLARVILAHGGDYQVDPDPGWRLELTWPTRTTSP